MAKLMQLQWTMSLRQPKKPLFMNRFYNYRMAMIVDALMLSGGQQQRIALGTDVPEKSTDYFSG